jgi:hypothetical protein
VSDDHDLDEWYRMRRATQAIDRLRPDYSDDGEQFDELELLRRVTRTSQQTSHVRHGRPGGADALDGLAVYSALADELELHQLRLIGAALDAGESFHVIGKVLGLTGDGVRARWRTGRHRIAPDHTER